MEFIYKALTKNPMGRIKYEGEVCSWAEGVYMKHLLRMPCPINDSATERDYEHLLFVEGLADWNMPTPIEKKVIYPDTLCLKLDVNIRGKSLYSNDIVSFKYKTSDIEYFGIGILQYTSCGVIIDTNNKTFAYSEVNVIDKIGNTIEHPQLKEKCHLSAVGFWGEIINAYWSEKNNGVTHTLIIQDGNMNSWEFGGLELDDEKCGIWIKHLMRVFGTKQIDKLVGTRVYVSIDNGKAAAIAVGGDFVRIMDSRNIFDNE